MSKMKTTDRFNPSQEDLWKALRPEERDGPTFNTNVKMTIGWCSCGVLTQLGIGCGYLCTRCQIKKYGRLLSTIGEFKAG